MRPASSSKWPVFALASILLIVVGALVATGVLAPRLHRAEGYRDLAERFGKEYNVQPELVLAVIAIESGGDPTACSRAGARGLMQLMPLTARDVARRLRVTDFELSQLDTPEVSVRFGTFYLRWLADQLGSDRPATILAAYNAGLGRVRQWLEGVTEPTDLDLSSRIQYPETRAYVTKVLDAWATLRARRSSD